jgi:hypothetical protein
VSDLKDQCIQWIDPIAKAVKLRVVQAGLSTHQHKAEDAQSEGQVLMNTDWMSLTS